MLKNVLQRRKSEERIKCSKCGQRDATREDRMCDSCRYLLTIQNIIKDSQ